MYLDKLNKNLFRLLKNSNHPNICLYGSNLGYDTIINTLKTVYNINANKEIDYKGIMYIKNNYYYEFNLKNIKYKNKDIWLELIKDICKSYNIFCNNKKIIIFNNFHLLNISIQNVLKVILEKNTHIIFIVLTLNLSKIINPIKSRMLCLRIPKINNYDKWKIIKKDKNCLIKIDDFMKYTDYDVENIKYLNNKNICVEDNILYNVIHFIKHSIFDNYEKKKAIENIKKISYYILTVGIPNCIFYNSLLTNLLSDYKITLNKKYKIVKFICDSEYNYSKSYYKMVHIEYLLLELTNIIKI